MVFCFRACIMLHKLKILFYSYFQSCFETFYTFFWSVWNKISLNKKRDLCIPWFDLEWITLILWHHNTSFLFPYVNSCLQHLQVMWQEKKDYFIWRLTREVKWDFKIFFKHWWLSFWTKATVLIRSKSTA